MKTITSSLFFSGLLASPLSAETLAAWVPAPETEPEGVQFGNATSTPMAQNFVPEILGATAARTNQGAGGNAGAVWPGSVNATTLDLASYTSFSLEIASDAAVDIESFSYVMNTYGFERETINVGTAQEEVILSTLQLRLRSSLDDFQSDLGSVTSLPVDRFESNDLNFTFDLRGAADLQGFSGPIEFRLYIWEESEVDGYDPFTWIDMAGGGAIFDGTVTDPTELQPIERETLVEIFPEPKPEADGLPANSTAVAPTLITLAPAIGSVEASRVGHGAWINRASVWPGRVGSIGLDENSYLETTITPGPGATFSIAEFTIPQINVYATDDGGAWQAAIRSSLDGFSEDLATTSGAGTYRVEFDLLSQASLRNLSAPITFRVYLWEIAAVAGANFDPLMWFDIAGNTTGTAPGIQIIGESRLGSVSPPSIVSIEFVEDRGIVFGAINLTPGRTYDLAVTFDLNDPFVPLEIEQTATETSLTFVDGFADILIDPKAFYRIEEVAPR